MLLVQLKKVIDSESRVIIRKTRLREPDFGKREVIFEGLAAAIPVRLENDRIEKIRPLNSNIRIEATMLIDLEYKYEI